MISIIGSTCWLWVIKKSYVDEDNKEDVKKELDKMTETTFKRFNSIYTNSLALNYAVNSKLEELEKNKINFISTIKYNLNTHKPQVSEN